MRIRRRHTLLAAALAAVATLPETASYAMPADDPPTLVAESSIAGQSVPSLVQASAWQPLKAGWESRVRIVTAPLERTAIHVRWQSPTFVLKRGESVFRTQEKYQAQGAPGTHVAITDTFRICFTRSGSCTRWYLGGAAASPFPTGLITYDVIGWHRSPWTGKEATAYFQWRFTWLQDNAGQADVTLLVQL